MGFFDAVLKALGFEVEDKPKKPKNNKQKQAKHGEFDLKQIGDKDLNLQTKKDFNEENEDLDLFDFDFDKQDFDQKAEKNYDAKLLEKTENLKNTRGAVKENLQTLNVKPLNQAQVQVAVDELKRGTNLIINLSYFEEEDVIRALDFLSGVCYCLNVKIKKINETTFALSY